MKGRGLTLTDSGLRCCNPACGAVLYVELMAAPDAEACFECDPEQFREGWSPAVVDLYECSGRRLPAHHRPEWAEYEGESFIDDTDASDCPIHCSAPCRSGRQAA